MQFKLIENGESIRKHDSDILWDAVCRLKDDEDSYIILEPKKDIANSIYLQGVRSGGNYVAEIRFIYNSADNLRHYRNVYDTKEQLYAVLADYYLDEKIPDIQKWIDDTHLFSDDLDEDMMKLYKNIGKQIHYFEVWINDEESVTIHEGILGDIGTTEDIFIKKGDGLSPQAILLKYVLEQKLEGYDEAIAMTELIIQYEDKGNSNSLTDKKESVEALLNNCLGWTGNGHCEGGDISDGKLNLICHVVDKDVAIPTILEILEDENLLSGLRIAYEEEVSAEYIQIYPNKDVFIL